MLIGFCSNINLKTIQDKMNEKIIIPNQENLKRTLNLIQKDWSSQIHVLADFDKTLTKAFVNGKAFQSIMAKYRDGGYMSKENIQKAHELYQNYHRYEIETNITSNERFQKMQEWREKSFQLMFDSKINYKQIEHMVENTNLEFRDWYTDFFDVLNKNNIPLVVISASWLWDSIDMFLDKHKLLTSNIDIITNHFERDKNWYATKIKFPIIHTCNKTEVILNQFPFYEKIKDRKNVILLGDTLEDTWMVEWFEYKNLIKIGFLNENIDNQMPFFKEKYDVIILNDGSMEYVNNLLKEIIFI